jgi:hypothetical protein
MIMDLNTLIKELESKIYELAGMEFNVQSPKQLGEVLFEKLGLPVVKKNKSGGYAIHYAEIGKVLFSEEEQRVIFFALGDYDGGGTDTAELGYFFTRFDIDEKEYQDHAYYTHQDQEKGILFKNRK